MTEAAPAFRALTMREMYEDERWCFPETEQSTKFRAVYATVCSRCGDNSPLTWRCFFAPKVWKVLDYKFRRVLWGEGWDAAVEFIREKGAVVSCIPCFTRLRANGQWKEVLEFRAEEERKNA